MSLQALVNPDGTVDRYRDFVPSDDPANLPATKPRWLPVIEENATFDPVTQVREGPQVIVELPQLRVRHVYTVRAKNAAEIEEMRAEKMRDLKREGMRRVGQVMTDDQQLLVSLAGLEGILSHGLDRQAWPQALQNTFNPLFNSATTSVKAIYQALRTKENELNALTTAAQIEAYDIMTGWP